MKEKMIQYFEGCGFTRAEAEKETKLEIVKTPKAIQEIQNTINDVLPIVATMGQNMGKDIAKAFRKAYENMGYEFKEIEIPKNELQQESEQ
jgi:hypothetical protein